MDLLFDQPQLFFTSLRTCCAAALQFHFTAMQPHPQPSPHEMPATVHLKQERIRTSPVLMRSCLKLWLHDRSLQACREVRSSLGPSHSPSSQCRRQGGGGGGGGGGGQQGLFAPGPQCKGVPNSAEHIQIHILFSGFR